jgi:VWFA-related protein
LRLVAEEVLLPVTAKGKYGSPAPELFHTDFIVVEDGKKQEITSLTRLPANILIVLDVSGEATLLKNANVTRDLAYSLVDSIREGDRAAIITYADRVSLVCDWTDDKSRLAESLASGFKPGLKSKLYEALIHGAEEMLSRVGERRIVLLVTDGIDSFSKEIFQRSLLALNRVRATVYVVSQARHLIADLKPIAFNKFTWYDRLDPQKRKRIDRLRRYVWDLESFAPNMEALAEETGGFFWSPASRDEFKGLAPAVVSEINLEYVLSYVSRRKQNDTEFHRVSVYTRVPGVLVRSRRGIYSSRAATERPETTDHK